MVVLPLALAMALVRKTFFGTIAQYDGYLQLFEQSSEKPQALMVLIGVQAFGARVPYLQDLLKEYGSTEHLKYYARIGEEEAHFVIQEFPELLLDTAPGFLEVDAEGFLPKVFDYVIASNEQIENNLSLLNKVIDSWLKELPPQNPEASRATSR